MIKMIKILLLILPLMLLFSCASAPEKETEPAAAAAPAQLTADREKGLAVDAMNKAKSIKAEIAVKQDFDAAMKLYNDAETLLASGAGTTAEAAAKYLEAEKAFLSSYDKAFVKMEAARQELDKAKEDIKNVESESATFEKLQAGGGA